ncbi:ABC transporter permease subunit [Anaerofilum sp. BX8]|uniref:ABC transporter permease subunit n=1 Tax=Anaerofilum hominis TaxID=2763016 RepID=A0A923I5Z8_9FIRM|nr:ABC transporter permease subunit [Anaerofilum hominis]MBC5580429.1 ABC transporter permease subunit [Anaerofilum hominis]
MPSKPSKPRWERAAAVLLALLVWQAAAAALGSALLLVSPLRVLQRLSELALEPQFYAAVGFSFVRIVAGFLLGLCCGTLLAAAASRWHLAEVLLWPYMTVIKTTPVASFIILCLIWLDSSSLPVFISFLMVLPIVYANMLEGIRQTDPKLLEMAGLFRARAGRRLLYIYLPQLRPYLTTACSVALGLSWKAGIAAEVIGIPSGSIGERLYEAKVYLSSADLFAWTVVIIAVSIAFEKLFLWLLRVGYRRLERL